VTGQRSSDGSTGARAGRRYIVGSDGRAKAYRPLPAGKRIAALVAGLDAYANGDFFEAHEHMEPAWMGTADPAERALIQGLIKVAAADVHAVRGNARGVVRNLEGARDRLLSASSGGRITGIDLDVAALLADIDARLAAGSGSSGPMRISWRRR
jgi:DUF309 family protein family protein